ncbi:DinB family protein [Bacillus timonensis]|nr:DinB family protein [Bacillus timonensis]
MVARHEVLFNQLESYRREVLGAVEGLSMKEAELIPTGFNNNIRWNLGHIYLDQYLWIKALTKEEQEIPAGFNRWFGYGSSPAHFTSETPSFEELKLLLAQQPNRIRELYADKLEMEYPLTEMNMHTIEQVLIRTIFHEGMHLHAILTLRRFI